MSHTPGPWEALETKPIAGCEVLPGWAISPMRGRMPLLDIAQVHCSASQKRSTQEANARLIAAAPELVEMLDNVTASLESCLARYGSHMAQSDDAARTALADKARALVDSLLRPNQGEPNATSE